MTLTLFKDETNETFIFFIQGPNPKIDSLFRGKTKTKNLKAIQKHSLNHFLTFQRDSSVLTDVLLII